MHHAQRVSIIARMQGGRKLSAWLLKYAGESHPTLSALNLESAIGACLTRRRSEPLEVVAPTFHVRISHTILTRHSQPYQTETFRIFGVCSISRRPGDPLGRVQ
jgi:hypothetical protein